MSGTVASGWVVNVVQWSGCRRGRRALLIVVMVSVVVSGRCALPLSILRGGAVVGDVSPVELNDAGQHPAQGLELVSDYQHGCSAPRQTGEHLAQDLLAGEVHPGGG